jgi:hypothetical protein
MYPFGTLTWFCLLGSLGRGLCSLAVGLALGMAQSRHRVGPQKCLRITFDTISTSRLVESAPSRRCSAGCSLWAQTTSSFLRNYPFEDLRTAIAFLRSAPIREDDCAKIAVTPSGCSICRRGRATHLRQVAASRYPEPNWGQFNGQAAHPFSNSEFARWLRFRSRYSRANL